jgi:catechol 2,3-dioxygenase-like lactoylglutathione lyase family enzyme
MATTLNHTVVPARDHWASARWLADLLDLEPPEAFGPFVGVRVGPTTLDYLRVDATEEVRSVHFAFLVDEDQFDRTFARLQAGGGDYFADPGGRLRGEINRHDGGRGVYFPDPDGHWMEIITVPYGGWPADASSGS